jgi:hypothetical protein
MRAVYFCNLKSSEKQNKINSMTMKRIYHLLFIIGFLFSRGLVNAQVKRPLTDADKESLEGIIVEKYYMFDPSDKMDTIGGCLTKGEITYRIYVDLKPNYTLQAVYGVNEHPLYIKTATHFFNNVQNGQGTADYVDSRKVPGTTAAFDSWLTVGAASTSQMGILKTDDKDGSVLKINSLEKADGLITTKIKPVTYFGIIPNFFNTYNNANTFTTNNGSWAIFGGIQGPTEDNRILIAQLTTDGELTFELNLQVGTPTGGNVNYVAENPQGMEIKSDQLKRTSTNN